MIRKRSHLTSLGVILYQWGGCCVSFHSQLALLIALLLSAAFLNIYICLPSLPHSLSLSLFLTELFPVIASMWPPQRAVKNNQILPGSKTHFRPFRAISLKNRKRKGCVLLYKKKLDEPWLRVGLGRSGYAVYGAVTISVSLSPSRRSHFQFYLWLYLLLCLCFSVLSWEFHWDSFWPLFAPTSSRILLNCVGIVGS